MPQYNDIWQSSGDYKTTISTDLCGSYKIYSNYSNYTNPIDSYWNYGTSFTPVDQNSIIGSITYCDEVINTKETLTLKAIPNSNLISLVEERIEEHILDNYDKQELKESGHYIYQIVQEKAYELASEALKEAEEEWIVPSETDELIEAILKEIDFDSIYDTIDNILDAPITMEDKLSEVGMSIRDFL